MWSIRVKQAVFCIVCVFVLYGIFRPTPPAMIFAHADKLGHIAAFMMLALSARLAFYKCSEVGFWLPMFLLAFLLEYLQGELLPLRVFSMGDVWANMVGVVLAFTCIRFFRC